MVEVVSKFYAPNKYFCEPCERWVERKEVVGHLEDETHYKNYLVGFLFRSLLFVKVFYYSTRTCVCVYMCVAARFNPNIYHQRRTQDFLKERGGLAAAKHVLDGGLDRGWSLAGFGAWSPGTKTLNLLLNQPKTLVFLFGRSNGMFC